jgi:acetylornithine/N-succinyldiaminopimelate aminotransferase
MNESQSLLSSSRFRAAKEELLQTILDSSKKVRGIKPSATGEAREQYLKAIQEFNKERGRDLFFPFLASGLGAGPFVELMDGSVKYDMITGIGINFFGHSHPELMGELIDGLSSDIMQGNLEPGFEAKELLHAILSRVGQGSRLKHGWLTTCGTMANENALKIIRQKKAPATKILAFRDCFAGRSTAMQEITDNPGYRQGQPVYGECYYLPFYDPKKGLDASIQATLGEMKDHLARFPGKFAAIMMEPVQGEGGFNFAPREWYTRVFDEAKKAGLAIWLDEIQTFGRTGELFAYQTLGLSEYPDVVTIAKMLQAGALLFTEEYNPKPGLVAGTFSGSSTALRAGRRSLEILDKEGYLGKDGKINRMSERFAQNIKKLSEGQCKGMIADYRNIGGMIALQPLSGALDDVKAVLLKLFDLGVVAFYCGHGPYLIRMLPPLGAMSESDVDQVCELIGRAIVEAAATKGAKK